MAPLLGLTGPSLDTFWMLSPALLPDRLRPPSQAPVYLNLSEKCGHASRGILGSSNTCRSSMATKAHRLCRLPDARGTWPSTAVLLEPLSSER